MEDRGTGAARPAPVATEVAAATKPLPGAENAGKPGYYTVKPGDTLIRIGLDNGQNWRDIKLWNNIENPNLIEVGQVIRVVPPNVDAAAVTARGVADRFHVDSAGTSDAGTTNSDAEPDAITLLVRVSTDTRN